MPEKEGGELLGHLEALDEYNKYNKLKTLYPETGPLRRELYPKHMEFFRAGREYRERAAIAANRVGKSFGIGGFEVALHLTGKYPEWWVGKRFLRPTDVWSASDTSETTRDIVQQIMLGDIGDFGTGLIPKDCILGVPTHRAGVPGAVDTVRIRHNSGGTSTLGFKCFSPGTRIKMADGSLLPIEKISLGQMVLCADGSARRVIETHSYADAPQIKIKTRSGEITVTPNHRMFIQRGEIEAGKLSVGDVLEIANPECGGSSREDWRVKITALMIGDGCTRGKTPFFTCNEPEIVADVKECLPPELYVVPIANTINYKISCSIHKNNMLKTSLEEDGLWYVKSNKKFIPNWVFCLPRELKVVFLRWLWGCDGTINSKDATYTSSSRRLIDDVRLLLWDLGIFAPIKFHLVKNQSGKTFGSYYISLHGENRLLFNEIGKLNRDVSCTLTPRPKGPPGEIIEISSVNPGNVYCVTVKQKHELIAEGYRVGNSFDQGRKKFQGTAKDVCWLDESPPLDVYTECLTRLMTRDGIMMCTFTPLEGLSEVVLLFLPEFAPNVTDINSARVYEDEEY